MAGWQFLQTRIAIRSVENNIKQQVSQNEWHIKVTRIITYMYEGI